MLTSVVRSSRDGMGCCRARSTAAWKPRWASARTLSRSDGLVNPRSIKSPPNRSIGSRANHASRSSLA